MSGVRMTGPWLPLDTEHVERLGGHMGVYELAAADGEVVRIGFAGGRSVFGLRGELRRAAGWGPRRCRRDASATRSRRRT